jgi:hypothetical protein
MTPSRIERIPLTRQFAEQIANLPGLPHEPPPHPSRIAKLEAILRDGTFHNCTWATVFVSHTGITYRAEGLHSSIVLSQAKSFPVGLEVRLLRLEVSELNSQTQLEVARAIENATREVPSLNFSTSPSRALPGAAHRWASGGG